jgi:ribonuclease HII
VRASSVAACKAELARATGEELRALVTFYGSDARSGVRDAVSAAVRRIERERAEAQRLERMHELENELRANGFAVVAGVDEVGRGALAGPVSAAAVVLPAGARITGLDDSKRLTPERRAVVAERIRSEAVCVGVAHVPAHIVDALGMTAAVRCAMERALALLRPPADHAITDGLRVGLPMPETPVVKGDASIAAVAAASVVAKVERDTLMASIASHYPEWEFHANKGYGTPEHLHAIAVHGICPLHRRSFAPCNEDPRAVLRQPSLRTDPG